MIITYPIQLPYSLGKEQCVVPDPVYNNSEILSGSFPMGKNRFWHGGVQSILLTETRRYAPSLMESWLPIAMMKQMPKTNILTKFLIHAVSYCSNMRLNWGKRR
ncbi:hypothetical protein BCF11_5075 [Collimonas sp. PA-H2]|nr:hypothetical protein BCF11_5075 [Collimonas sp. PA-H2]